MISNIVWSQDCREQSMPTTTVLLMKGNATAATIKNIGNINRPFLNRFKEKLWLQGVYLELERPQEISFNLEHDSIVLLPAAEGQKMD